MSRTWPGAGLAALALLAGCGTSPTSQTAAHVAQPFAATPPAIT